MEEERYYVNKLSKQLGDATPERILEWAIARYGDGLVLACSFGAEDVVLVDMYSRLMKSPRIFYLDTDLHFRETYETRDRLADRYGISFIQVKTDLTLKQQAEKYGENLWESEPNLCCEIRKVIPLTNILKQNKAWITGIRREQSTTRANAQKLEWDAKFNLVKLNPLADWTSDDVWSYIRANNIPYNPLHDQNYPSIGCSVCTKAVKPGEDPRSGRWAGFTKTECGLHK